MLKLKKTFIFQAIKYKKEFRGYFLLTILSLLLGVILFFSVFFVAYNQVQEHGTVSAAHFRSEATSMLREMNIVSNLITADQQVSSYLEMDQISNYCAMNLCEILRVYGCESPYVNEIYLISDSQDCIYSNRGLYKYEALPAITKRIGETETTFEAIQKNADKHGWNMVGFNYTAPYYIEGIPLNDNYATLIITLKMTQFVSILYNVDTEMCCLCNNNCCISTLQIDRNLACSGDDRAISELLGVKVNCFRIQEGNFTYLVAVSHKEYFAPVKYIIWGFSLYFATVLIFGLFHAFRTSRKKYNVAVERARGLSDDSKEFVTIDELEATISNALNDYKKNRRQAQEWKQSENILYLINEDINHTEAIQFAKNAGLKIDSESFFVITLHIRNSEVLKNTQVAWAQYADIIKSAFYSVFMSLDYSNIHATCAAIPNKLIVVLCVPNDADVIKIIREITYELKESYGIETQSMVSNRKKTVLQINEAYEETRDLYRFAIAIDSGVELMAHKDSEYQLILNGNYLRQTNILMNTLFAKKYSLIPAMVRGILQEHVESVFSNYVLANERISGLSHILHEAVLQSGVKEIDYKACSERFRKANSISSLNEATCSVYGMLNRICEHENKEDVFERARDFIKENACNANLSVPDICDACCVSTQHLSRIFRKKLGITITDYLTNYRIGLAKELLQDKKLRISEVSEMVGYNSNKTFTRNFQSVEGITPSEFRNI